MESSQAPGDSGNSREEGSFYSHFVSGTVYNQEINAHVYVKEADNWLVGQIARLSQDKKGEILRIADLGGGPARMAQTWASIRNLEADIVDHDPQFVADGQQIIDSLGVGSRVRMVQGDIRSFVPEKPYDAAVLQGTAHHFEKDEEAPACYAQIAKHYRRVYVQDEILPEYDPEDETSRLIVAIIWYLFVINQAQRGDHESTVIEEVSILLDELGFPGQSAEFGEVIREAAISMGDLLEKKDFEAARQEASKLLDTLRMRSTSSLGSPSNGKSRGDYKVSHSVFMKELAPYFHLVDRVVFGDLGNVGAMVTYVLESKISYR
jgi:hypothetical protein